MLWGIVFAFSSLALLVTAFRSRLNMRLLNVLAINFVLAALLIYLINVTPWFGDFRIPINLITVVSIGLLGIPGLLLIISIHFFII